MSAQELTPEKIAEEKRVFEEMLKEERDSLEKYQASRRADFERGLALRIEESKKPKTTAPPPQPQQPPVPAPKGQEEKKEEEECPTGKATGGCSGCSLKESCGKQKQQQAETNSEIQFRMQFVKHKLLVLSGKGGVGKSMVSSQLAFSLARRGFRVGLMDVDICGPTVPKMVGARGRGVTKEAAGLVPVQISENLCAMSIGFIVDDENEAVIWRGPRKLGLITMFLKDVNWGPLDFLLVDTPPGTSDEHISVVQLLTKAGMDGAVVVTSPQDVSVIEVGKEINFCERMKVPVMGVIENFASFACPLCSAVTDIWPPTSGGGLRLASDHGVPFLGRIPLDPMIARVGEIGSPIAVSQTPTSVALESITDQLLASMAEDFRH